MTANAVWNPFHDRNAGRLDLNRFFGGRSYHRTGGESYYGLLYTCKGYKEFFYIFFTASKRGGPWLWHAKSMGFTKVDSGEES